MISDSEMLDCVIVYESKGGKRKHDHSTYHLDRMYASVERLNNSVNETYKKFKSRVFSTSFDNLTNEVHIFRECLRINVIEIEDCVSKLNYSQRYLSM
jgi:hypothetical protein